jgi:hypothetical protein
MVVQRGRMTTMDERNYGIEAIDLTNMQVFALTAHEMYLALVESGFDEDTAITFVVRFALETHRADDAEEDK